MGSFCHVGSYNIIVGDRQFGRRRTGYHTFVRGTIDRDRTGRVIITARRIPSFRLISPSFGKDPVGNTFATRLKGFVTCGQVSC